MENTEEYAVFRTAQPDIVAQSQRLDELGLQRLVQAIARQANEAERALNDDFIRLESDEAGRRIAAHELSLRRYAALRDSADLFRDNAQATTEPELTVALVEIQRLRQTLAAIEDAAKSPPVGPSTLKQAVASLKASLDKDRNQLVADQVRQSTEALTERKETVTAQKEHAARLLAETNQRLVEERRKTSSLLDQQRELIENQGQKLAAERAAAGQALAASLPHIRDKLTPFIVAGYAQPDSRAGLATKIDKIPMSYTALLSVGALEPSLEGLETLVQIAGRDHPGRRNDRPLGRFPRSNYSVKSDDSSVLDELEVVQRFLRDHGAAMVDAGLLSP